MEKLETLADNLLRVVTVRPRFSLRFLLAGFTAFAVFLYAWFVRPTTNATRFIDTIHKHDFETAVAVLIDEQNFLKTALDGVTVKVELATAELFPRDWSDICTGRRRLALHLKTEATLQEGSMYYDLNLIVYAGVTSLTSEYYPYVTDDGPLRWDYYGPAPSELVLERGSTSR